MWQRIQEIGKLFAAIAVPVVVALVGYWIQASIQQAEISARMVELAVGILQEDVPEDVGMHASALREYGIELLEHYSAVPLAGAVKDALRVAPLPALEGAGSNPVMIDPTTWGSQPWGSSPVGGPSASPDPEE